MISIGLNLKLVGMAQGAVLLTPWILSSGTWNDNGIWKDTSVWID